jgi:glutamate-1-semialdehyde 2,1-aminomutase
LASTAPKDYYSTKGKDPEAARQIFILPWNDIDAVKDCFEKYGDQVAMVHCEIIAYNHFGLMPCSGFF